MCLLMACALAGCNGCQGRTDRQVAEKDATPKVAEKAPVAQAKPKPKRRILVPWMPSPSAMASAAYLAVYTAMSNHDEEGLLEAAEVLAKAKGADQPDPRYWIEPATWLVERNSINAIPFLASARKAWPEDLALLLLHTEILGQRTFHDDALRELEAFLEKHPDSSEAKLQKAVTLLRAKRTEEALACLDTISSEGRTGFVEYYHARALAEAGREKDAIKHLRAAVKLVPEFPEALNSLAFLLEKHGEEKEARACYEKLLHLQIAPKDVRDITLRLIAISLRAGQPGAALASFRKGPEDIAFRMQAASIFAEFRHYLQAERILKEAAQDPGAPHETFLFLADLTYEQRQDLNGAMAWLARIPEDSPLAPRKMLLKARFLAASGNVDAALAEIAACRERFADSAETWEMQARILSHAKRHQEALSAARSGVERFPASADLNFLLGSLLAESGQKAEALTFMEQVVARQPDNWQALNFVGYSLAEENRDIDRALELLTHANDLAPGQFFVLDSLAWACYRAGRLDEAWAWINEAQRLDPSGDPAIFEHMGDIAKAKGLPQEARKAWRKAIDKKSENAEAIRARMDALQP